MDKRPYCQQCDDIGWFYIYDDDDNKIDEFPCHVCDRAYSPNPTDLFDYLFNR